MSLNLATILHDAALRFPERISLQSEERTFTFLEMFLWAKKISSALASIGINRGDHVVLMAPNVPEFTAAYFGILNLGAIVVPINTMLVEQEIAYLLEHSDASCFIAWAPYADRCFKAFRMVDDCEHLIFLGPDSEKELDNLKSFDASLTNVVSAMEPLLQRFSGDIDTVQTGPGDTAVILYTSGTTGRPKGAELSHFNMYSNAFYCAYNIMHFTVDDVGLGILPLFHSFGQTVVQNAMMITGSKIVLVPQFEPKKALYQIQQHRITFLSAVPTMFHMMLQHKKRHNIDTSSLKLAVSGGASLSVSLFKEFQEAFALDVREGYGLSETSPITNFTPILGLNKPGSIGPEIIGTHVKIMNDDGDFVQPGEIGELVVRGHNVMKGYYKDPLATQAAFINNWFRTGDVAKMDEDGYVYIVDRKKDVIIRAGMNIYPREIEEILLHHPNVKEVSVVGIPDATLSENVIAFVSLVEGASTTSEELLRYCRDHLAPFKCPKTVRFLEQLPKGPTGKIQKRDLRNML